MAIILPMDLAMAVRGQISEGYYINPRPLDDGKFILPEAVLTDPKHSSINASLATLPTGSPTNYLTGSKVNIKISGVGYSFQTSLRRGTLFSEANGGIFSFNIQQGDRYSYELTYDRPFERSEIVQVDTYPLGTEIWQSYAWKITDGASISFPTIIGQWHSAPDYSIGQASSSPPFSFEIGNPDTHRVVTRFETDPGYTANPIRRVKHTRVVQRDRWYNTVLQTIFSPTDATLNWWLDGVQILNLTGFGMGYAGNLGNYWRIGAYRPTAPEAFGIKFANMEFGTSSLFARVATPLAIPA